MLVTLLTDFGTADYFVAAMKGVILTRQPRVSIVDITHQVPAHDIGVGAFTLLAVYPTFPAATIHVCVVDPGVGSSRRPILALAGGQMFVGPDNGLFSYVLDREPPVRVLHLNQPRFFRHPVSTTFHGRDIFAPVAGALASGVSPDEVGTEITDFVRLEPIVARRAEDGTVRGSVVQIDHFGNCITSIAREDLPVAMRERGFGIRIGKYHIHSIRRYFAGDGGAAGEPFGIWGSAGLLEIAIDRDSAARRLGIQRGDPVHLFALGERGGSR